MRAGLMPLIVIVTAVIGAGPSRSEEPRLADKTPDGAQLIDLYKAARTVADVEAANGKVKDEVLTAQSVASDLARLHAAKMTVCEDVEASHLEASAAKARAFSATLIRIDGELTKSLAAMRQKLATERSSLDQGEGRCEPAIRSQRTNWAGSICRPKSSRKRSRASHGISAPQRRHACRRRSRRSLRRRARHRAG